MVTRKSLRWACFPALVGATLMLAPAKIKAEDDKSLRTVVEQQSKLLEQQSKQIEELKKRLDGLATPAVPENGVVPFASSPGGPDKATLPPAPEVNEALVSQLMQKYLAEHPIDSQSSPRHAGYSTATGFFIRSGDPSSFGDADVPFELRFRGWIQLPYEFYKVTDSKNHLTGINTGNNTAGDFSAIEIKRARLVFEGILFTPDLRYQFQIDGNTRGIPAFNSRVNGLANPIGNVQSGDTIANVDNAVRLYGAWIAYDFHGSGSPDCYRPTFTLIGGKMKPLFNLEEYLGSKNQQFVEYSMADWFFSADDDNYLVAAGLQVKAFDDRLFFSALVTNGNESQTPALQLDRLPGVNVGAWWDFGGTWNADRKRWDLFGDCLADIDNSQHLVVRVGGATNLVPMDRRSIYDDAEVNRVRAMPGSPNASGSLLSILNGAGLSPNTAGISSFTADAFDEYTFELFAAAKYKGFSLYNDWWVRDIDNFRGQRIANSNLNRPILYTSNTPSGATSTALFPTNHGLVDFGSVIQGGYFVVPNKLEVVARYSWVCGESGNINGKNNAGAGPLVTIPGVPTPVRIVNGAFSNFQQADEVAFGVNYYFRRQLVKWQNDIGFYHGGNPASNGQSNAGFIPGVDGWMFRSQVQLAF